MKKCLRICAILHVFHEEFLNEILDYLKNLENISSFDLFVTMRPEIMHLAQGIENYFSKQKVNLKIIPFKNLRGGADIWPFLYVVNNINLNDYDVIFKLHTKQNIGDSYFAALPQIYKNNVFLGYNLWRNFLLNEILGGDSARRLLSIFKHDKHTGEIGFMPFLLKEKKRKLKIYTDKIKKAPRKSKCFAGSIFAIRANLLSAIQNLYSESDFGFIAPGDKFSVTAVNLERFFGELVLIQNKKLRGANPFSNLFILKLLSHKKTFPLFKFYCNKFIFKKELIK